MPAPPSLKNMYIALKNDYPNFKEPPRKGGLLKPWADRGVLLLNTCLTVRAHEANSHSNRGWERFTQRVIDVVAQKKTRGVVFMAWGTPAGKRVMKVDGSRHLVLKAVHPSPLSAARGFFTCGHFKRANEWLKTKHGAGSEIDWSLGPREEKVIVEVEVKKVENKEGDIVAAETAVTVTKVDGEKTEKSKEDEEEEKKEEENEQKTDEEEEEEKESKEEEEKKDDGKDE